MMRTFPIVSAPDAAVRAPIYHGTVTAPTLAEGCAILAERNRAFAHGFDPVTMTWNGRALSDRTPGQD